MSDYTVPVFTSLAVEPAPKSRRGGPHNVRLSDGQVRNMRRLYDVDMLTASQVHALYPQVSLRHVVCILDRKARHDVK
jgi:hypothetical protein